MIHDAIICYSGVMKADTITREEYRALAERQQRLEKEISLLKDVVQIDLEGEHIRPEVLRRLDRMSRDLDAGKGKRFASMKEFRKHFRAR